MGLWVSVCSETATFLPPGWGRQFVPFYGRLEPSLVSRDKGDKFRRMEEVVKSDPGCSDVQSSHVT